MKVVVGLELTETGFAGQRLDRFGIAASTLKIQSGLIERRGDTRGSCELDWRELLQCNDQFIAYPAAFHASTPPFSTLTLVKPCA
jgi:hypothetical protein